MHYNNIFTPKPSLNNYSLLSSHAINHACQVTMQWEIHDAKYKSSIPPETLTQINKNDKNISSKFINSSNRFSLFNTMPIAPKLIPK